MPEDTTNKEVRTVQKQETTEIINKDGRTLEKSPLSSLFDQMEKGVPLKDAAKKVKEEYVQRATAERAQKPPEKSAPEKAAPEKVVEAEKPKPPPEEEALAKKLSQSELDLSKKEETKKVEEDVSREKLLKELESKPTVKDDKPKDDDEVKEEFLQPQAHDSPATVKRIKALWAKTKKWEEKVALTEKERDEKAAKLAEMEKRLTEVKSTSPEMDEAIKKKLDELAMFRRRYELDSDPEVKAKFDDRIISAEKPIIDTLTKNGAGDGLIKIINEEGGWLKFAQSGRTIQMQDGVVSAAELADTILKNLPFSDRKTIDALTVEQITTKREKERFYAEQQRTANDYFKAREEAVQKSAQANQQQVEEIRKVVEQWQKEIVEKTDWLKEKAVPDDAPAEKKAEAEEDNRYTRQLNSLLRKAIETKDIKGMLEVVLDSVQFYNERRAHRKTQTKLAETEKRLAKLQEELDNFKNSSRSVSRHGSISGAGTAVSEGKAKPPTSLSEALNRIAAGEKLE